MSSSDNQVNTSEAGGESTANNNTGDENMLDDLMQNNVLFDEDEKPKCQDEG